MFLGPDLPSPCPASCARGIQVEDLYRNGMEHAQDPILEDALFSRLVYSQEGEHKSEKHTVGSTRKRGEDPFIFTELR